MRLSSTITRRNVSRQGDIRRNLCGGRETVRRKGLIDLVATMGYYDTVAMTLITAQGRAPKEDDVPQLAALSTALPRSNDVGA